MLCVFDVVFSSLMFVFFQAEDGIRDLVRSRGLGDVYKRQRRSGRADDSCHLHRDRRTVADGFRDRPDGAVHELSLIHI